MTGLIKWGSVIHMVHRNISNFLPQDQKKNQRLLYLSCMYMNSLFSYLIIQNCIYILIFKHVCINHFMSKVFLSLESYFSLPTLQKFLINVETFICSICYENLEASFTDFPVDITIIKVKKNFIKEEADTCLQFKFLPQFLKLSAEEQFTLFIPHFPLPLQWL